MGKVSVFNDLRWRETLPPSPPDSLNPLILNGFFYARMHAGLPRRLLSLKPRRPVKRRPAVPPTGNHVLPCTCVAGVRRGAKLPVLVIIPVPVRCLGYSCAPGFFPLPAVLRQTFSACFSAFSRTKARGSLAFIFEIRRVCALQNAILRWSDCAQKQAGNL